jgi:hypothetical protein
MKRIIPIAIFLSSFFIANAQIDHYRNFIFYNSSSFGIKNYMPVSFAPVLPTQLEGYSEMNDTCGNNLVVFSSNGIRVHDGTGADVTGTPLLLGSTNSTNAATIVKLSGNRALIITTTAFSSATNRAYYTRVDYTGACPSVVTVHPTLRNQPITSGAITNFSEKVTVTRKLGTNNYWLIMHEATNALGGSNKYIVFEIDDASATVILPGTVYAVGIPIRKIGGKGQMQSTFTQTPTLSYVIGAAHFLRATGMNGGVDILWQDPTTGALTFNTSILYGTFPYPTNRPYGLEFSSSAGANYMYVGSRFSTRNITRYGFNTISYALLSTFTTNSYPGLSYFGQIQRLDNGTLYSPVYGTNKYYELASPSSSTSFPTLGVTFSTSTGSVLRWGLPNYWK